MTHSDGIEVAKLLAQFLGALLVARLAVFWALRRYKSETAWERRLGAYVDALTALSEMRLVVGRWHDEIITDREPSPDQAAAQLIRYQTARRRLDEGIATAALLLPRTSADCLTGLDRKLEASRRGRDQVDDLDAQYAVVDGAISHLIDDGRRVLGDEFAEKAGGRRLADLFRRAVATVPPRT